MIDRHLADVECPAGCDALVCVEVTVDGRARAFGHSAMGRPCAGEREALADLFPPPEGCGDPGDWRDRCRRAARLGDDGRGVVLCFSDDRSQPSAWRAMQLRLDLTEGPAPAAALWEFLGAEQREAAMAILAALIAQTVVARETGGE